MKKISTLIIALVAATLAMNAQPALDVQLVKMRVNKTVQRLAGQQKPSRLTEEDILAACPDSVVTWETSADGTPDPNSKTKTAYTYDSKKRVATETNYTWEDGEWEQNQKITNTYEGDVLVSALIEDATDWFGTGLKKETYTYNADGLLTSTLIQKVDGENLINSDRYTNTYDDRGRLVETLDEVWDGDSWRNSGKEVITYEGDKAITQKYGAEGGQDWVLEGYSVEYLNELGMPYREDEYEQDEETGEFILAMVVEVAYRADGLPESMKILYNAGEGELVEMGSGTYVYELNAKGLPTKIISTMKIDFFGMYTMETTTVTCYYFGDGTHVDKALSEPAITSRRFYGMDGKETSGANRGLYIVVTEYADGTRTTVKSVRR